MVNLFDTILVHPLLNLLLVVYHLLLAVHIPYTLGFAIIGLTALIRLLLFPLMSSQLKASKKMQELAPHVNKLKEKHKGDNQKIQQATMALYKEHGLNPMAGCLPMLLQLPLLFALYSVLQHVVGLKPEEIVSNVNKIAYIKELGLTQAWDTHFFGLSLGQHPAQLIQTMPLILLIPAATAALQFVQAKMMTSSAPKTPQKKEEKKDQDMATEFSQAMQTQSLYILPLFIGWASYNFPIGLSLYWNTFTLFGILQQYQLNKSSSIVKTVKK